jgi:UDP-2,4-diacetamido-2,4,6-trideoxy-beta-L-altropyranose hydrolase
MVSHRIIIRADAGHQMGTGHIMRCIALAQALKKCNIHATFISHCNEKLRQKVVSMGFDLLYVDQPYPDPMDMDVTLRQIREQNAQWLIVDGYRFTAGYTGPIRDAGVKILYIDDYNHLPVYSADILLNQNPFAPDLVYHCPPGIRMLLGTEFVLLRDEFLDYRTDRTAPLDSAGHLLITMGGSDPENVTVKVIEAVKESRCPSLFLTVVLGPENTQVIPIRALLETSGSAYRLVQDARDMPALMHQADMAVSAGGSTAWELAYMGVPALYVITAGNQEQIVSAIEACHMGLNAGWHHQLTRARFAELIRSLVRDRELRARFSKISQNTVDGTGSKKVAALLYHDLLSTSGNHAGSRGTP